MKIVLSILTVLLVLSCAQINPLTGGARDVSAPKLDSSKTSPLNGTIQFEGKEVKLVFHEFISLKNPNDNIVITPQLKTKPSFQSKNKTFSLVFNEELEENTTYSINFNGAIADYTENNDSVFQYVFSTGSFIDSLKITGKITDAFTNKASDKIIIGLYPVEASNPDFDSIPILIKPTYFAMSDKNGDFTINYIKTGSYYLFAFQDLDKNLKYNPFVEKFSFANDKLKLDTNITAQKLKLFQQKKEEIKLLSSQLEYPGKLTLVFSSPPENFKISPEENLKQEHSGKLDSLIYWLKDPTNNTYILNYNTKVDTIKLLMKNKPKNTKYVTDYESNLLINKILPEDTLTLIFNEPILSVDKSLISLFDTDSNSVEFLLKQIDLRTIQLFTPEKIDARINIDSGAIVSTFSKTNTSININYGYYDVDYWGQLELNLNAFENNSNVIIQLLDDKAKLIQLKNTDLDSSKHHFQNLKPGQYQIRAIFDDNMDGEWTSGNLNNRTQPESVIYYNKLIKIRSNWNISIDWYIE